MYIYIYNKVKFFILIYIIFKWVTIFVKNQKQALSKLKKKPFSKKKTVLLYFTISSARHIFIIIFNSNNL